MNDEIQRRLELALRDILQAALPGKRFYPAKGDDESDLNADTMPEPPFGIIETVECQKMMENESTWLASVAVSWVTHMDDTGSAEHSADVDALHRALESLPRQFVPARRLSIHGTDISGVEQFLDESRKAHGDVVNLTIGVTLFR